MRGNNRHAAAPILHMPEPLLVIGAAETTGLDAKDCVVVADNRNGKFAELNVPWAFKNGCKRFRDTPPSVEVEAAVHLDHFAGDELGLIGREEAGDAGDVVRFCETAERSRLDGLLLYRRRPGFSHWRLNHAGIDGIHADALRTES